MNSIDRFLRSRADHPWLMRSHAEEMPWWRPWTSPPMWTTFSPRMMLAAWRPRSRPTRSLLEETRSKWAQSAARTSRRPKTLEATASKLCIHMLGPRWSATSRKLKSAVKSSFLTMRKANLHKNPLPASNAWVQPSIRRTSHAENARARELSHLRKSVKS